MVDTDPNPMITGSPVVYGGIAYVGISSKGEGNAEDSFRGAVIALDAATGRLLWKTYMVPSNNGGGDSNKPGYYSGNAVWESTFAVDPARGLLYIDTGNNYSVPAGVCTTPRADRVHHSPPLTTTWTRSWRSSSVTARSPGPIPR